MATSGLIHTRHADIPWLNLGVSVPIVDDGGVSSSQILQQAAAAGLELDFPVAVRDVGAIVAQSGELVKCEADGQRVIVRALPDGTARALGAARSQYTPVRTRDAFTFLDGMRRDGAPLKYERAGILNGGKRVFIQAQVGDNWAVRTPHGDAPLKDRVTFTCGHDGTFGLKVGLSDVAIVCENTFAMASAQCEHTLKHTTNVGDRITDALDAIAEGLEAQMAQRPALERMAATHMDRESFAEFAIAWIRGIERETRSATVDAVAEELESIGDRARKRTENAIAELYGCFKQPELGAHGETQYDALMAVTAFIDHQRNRAARGRQSLTKLNSATESAWWGDGASKKARAVRMLTRW